MVKICAEYTGNLHCVASHPSGFSLETDAPRDNGGRGQAFSPTDLVATALVTCISTVMGLYAQRKGIELKGMQLEVSKEMVNVPLRRIGALEVEISMPSSLSLLEDSEKENLEKIAHSCPVHHSLHPDIHVSIHVCWRTESSS